MSLVICGSEVKIASNVTNRLFDQKDKYVKLGESAVNGFVDLLANVYMIMARQCFFGCREIKRAYSN